MSTNERIPDKQASQVAAFFDVDGTIVEATVVHYYAYFATYGFSTLRRAWWTLLFLPRIVYYLILDQVSRSRFNRVFYARYRNMQTADIKTRSLDHFNQLIRPRMFSGAVERIEQHQARGERVILITGSLDVIIQPLAEHLNVDDLIAVEMAEEAGRLTGQLTGLPIGDEEKARIMRSYAETHQIDLTQSFAYADSSSDLPMLRDVGHPVVVNPKKKLKQIAEKNGWGIETWEKDTP